MKGSLEGKEGTSRSILSLTQSAFLLEVFFSSRREERRRKKRGSSREAGGFGETEQGDNLCQNL